MEDRIEILSTALLESQRPLIAELKRLARNLGLEFGWHYLLDLTWILSQLGDLREGRIMDAGAGVGIMQWYLAGKGLEVVSVDRESRASLSARFRRNFQVQGLRDEDLDVPGRSSLELKSSAPMKSRALDLMYAVRAGMDRRIHTQANPARGRVTIYNQDLKNLIDIPDGSMDAVVAVSALEHNPPEELEIVVAELLRVLKPGGALLATLGAAKDEDWYHVPSQGWCYSESTLRNVFDLAPQAASNFDQYDTLFAALRDCQELKDGLAQFYSRSGDNGMPWGIWDPQYQPVGVKKIKSNT